MSETQRSVFPGAGPRGTRAILAAGLVAILAGCQSPVRAPAFTLTREDWGYAGAKGKRLITDHFDVRTTLQDQVLVDVLPGFLESCYERYQELIPPRVEPGQPLATYVFETRWQWGRFTDEFVPERARVYRNIQSGGYMDSPTATAVLYWLGRDRTLAVAAHEGWHQYVSRTLPLPIPAWLNEGLATQMEAFELSNGIPRFEPRKNYFRRNYLRTALVVKEKGLFDLSELLRINAGDVLESSARPTDTYYAQLWSMTLFLLEGPDKTYRDGFRTLLADAGTETMRVAVNAYRVATPAAANLSFGEIVFRKYITEDLDAFSGRYIQFARDLLLTTSGMTSMR